MANRMNYYLSSYRNTLIDSLNEESNNLARVCGEIKSSIANSDTKTLSLAVIRIERISGTISRIKAQIDIIDQVNKLENDVTKFSDTYPGFVVDPDNLLLKG